MNFDKFEHDMQSFAFGQFQDFVALMDTLKAKGYSLDDLRLYVSQRQRLMAEQSERRSIIIKCPVCESPMLLRFINIPKGKRNVNGYRSCLECLACGHEQYSTEHPEQVLDKYTKNMLGSMVGATEQSKRERKAMAATSISRCGKKKMKNAIQKISKRRR